jgi:hypothetical protein
MKQKQVRSFLSLLLFVSVLLLIALPNDAFGQDGPIQSVFFDDFLGRLRSLRTPGAEPQQTGDFLVSQAPISFIEQDIPEDAADQKTLPSIADSTIAEGYPTVPGGDTVDMLAGYDPPISYDAKELRSLVKFNIVSLPPNIIVTKATLRVHLIGSGDTEGKIRTIRAYRLGQNWNEMSVTWNNKPLYNEGYGSTSIKERAWGWYEFDVTGLVQGWYKGNYTNNGLMLHGPDSTAANPGWRAFSTREGPFPPQLVVNYSATAEPAEFVYLPVIFTPNVPPAAPVLNEINNADNDGNYSVSWSAVAGADSYLLQEDDNAAFSSPESPYTGFGTVWNASGKAVGTYFYRVKARNPTGDSGWSNIRSVTVFPPPDHYSGSSPKVSFDVIGDQVCSFDITVPYSTGTCRIRAKSGVCFDIVNNKFRLEMYYADFGITDWIEGNFNSSRSSVSGNYSIYICGNTLIIPPSTGSWDASRQ